MAKGTKLSEFERVKITALKRVGKSQIEISKALGRNKSSNKNGARKPTGSQEKNCSHSEKHQKY